MDDRTLRDLISALPDGVAVTDRDTVEKYRYDWSRDSAAGTPAVVVRAEDAGQVQTAVRWAAAHGVPVVPRGAGSGLSGGSSAVDGGMVLSLERMRAVEIDTECQVAVVEPGALNAEVKKAAGAHGLWYPPDPSSYEICSIGGNIATNAGGLCCVKYGVTTDYVLGLDVVLADGTLITSAASASRTSRATSLMKLFVGSEGTLGIVTRAILRLVPAQAARSTMVAAFPTVDAAARAVVAVRRTIRPSMLELMDQASIHAVEDYRSMGLDRRPGALLVAQSDAPGIARSDEVELMRTACEVAGATEVFVTDDADEGEIVRRGPPDRASRRSRRAARCSSRTSARRSRCCRGCWSRSPTWPAPTTSRSPSSRTPATATPTRSSSTTPPTRTRRSGPARRSAR